MRGVAPIVAVGLVCAGLAGCGGTSSTSPPPAPPPERSAVAPPVRPDPSVATEQAARCNPARTVAMRGPERAFSATVVRATAALRAPGGSPIARFGPLNANDVPTVFGVLAVRRTAECRPAWYRVQLPLRPNGAVGWVRAADVRLARVTTRIEVDLGRRRAVLFRDGRRLVSAVVAIGAPGTPTPVGDYYVNQRLRASDPTGPFGPGAIGISAFSPTLVDWVQGGPIAIHGTNAPHTIGQAASFGCMRVANETLQRMFDLAVEGTPVRIVE